MLGGWWAAVLRQVSVVGRCVQVGVQSGLQVSAEVLLLSMTGQCRVGSALAALLNSPSSQALLSALEEAIRHASGAPMFQVRTQCWGCLGMNDQRAPCGLVLNAPLLPCPQQLRHAASCLRPRRALLLSGI